MLRCADLTEGIKICRTPPLDCLCSAWFLDHRAIILAVMGLTKNSGNGICNWCLFSMHLRPAYPFALPCLPPAPCSMGEPRLPVPLPSHYHCRPRGAARALRGEAAVSGCNAGFACSDTRYMVKSSFSWVSKRNAVCLPLIMDDENWLSFSALHKIICVCVCAGELLSCAAV